MDHETSSEETEKEPAAEETGDVTDCSVIE